MSHFIHPNPTYGTVSKISEPPDPAARPADVDIADFTMLASNFYHSLPAADGSPGSPVPEPSAIASLLLAVVACGSVRRRSRAH